MSPFIHGDFLLTTPEAKTLFHSYAEGCPILDYHSHLYPRQLAQNEAFENIAQAWLQGDHYKWRAMRTCGINERFITGDASDLEKFQAWASVVPKLLKNPLYHWTHLELKAYFGIEDLLSPETAPSIWERANAILRSPGHGALDLLKSQNVSVVCTTDDPCDDLQHHIALNAREKAFKMYPTWRPEKAMKIADADAFRAYLARLEKTAGFPIQSWSDFLSALEKRHVFFGECGCRISDYSVESFADCPSEKEASDIFENVRAGGVANETDAGKFAAYMLFHFGALDAATGWVRQLHVGALRNPNRAMFVALGPDTGFDAVDDFSYARPLASHLSALAERDALPRTILYNLNPKENVMLAVLCGSFQDGTPGGKLNFGAAWWFLDQASGMRAQLETLAQLGCLSQFVGMLTDSRSVLSMPRHDYFRRILCEMLGADMASGVIPADLPRVGEMVRDMCCRNAENYFSFKI